MAEVVIPEGFGLATLIWSLSGHSNPITVTCGYEDTTLGGDAGVAAQDIKDTFTASGALCDADLMSTLWTFEGVDVKEMIGGVLVGASSAGPAVVGTAASVNIPSINTSMLIRKRTIRIGRQFRGRMYFPCLALFENNVNYLGVIDNAVWNTFATALDVVSTTWLASDHTRPRILHAPPKAGATPPPTDIVSFTLETQVATQRRRMR